jgi:hypothetical protein
MLILLFKPDAEAAVNMLAYKPLSDHPIFIV